MRILAKYEPFLYAVLRIVAGLLFACHGAQKLLGWFGGQQVTAPLMIAAGAIELVGGLLIALGLFTGIAAFVASGEMAVAYFKAHFPHGPWPLLNHGELAVLYCFVFLYLSAAGPGQWSVDASRRRGP